MFPKLFQKLIDHFTSLPSIGPRMAERLVLYLFKQDKQKIQQFAKDLYEFGSNLNYCEKCFHVAEKDLCEICADKKETTVRFVLWKILSMLLLLKNSKLSRGLPCSRGKFKRYE